jgi:hypothetical protein
MDLDWGSNILKKIDLIDPNNLKDNEDYDQNKDYIAFPADKTKEISYYKKVLVIQTAVDEQYLQHGGLLKLN